MVTKSALSRLGIQTSIEGLCVFAFLWFVLSQIEALSVLGQKTKVAYGTKFEFNNIRITGKVRTYIYIDPKPPE